MITTRPLAHIPKLKDTNYCNFLCRSYWSTIYAVPVTLDFVTAKEAPAA